MLGQYNEQAETGAVAISFAERLVTSDAFRVLFQDGMALVEATAAYLDSEGRDESRLLPRQGALAYATESMRLTTRLMQMTSWLLLQRAVNEGELTRSEADHEHRKVRLAPAETASAPEMLAQLPPRLLELIDQSMRLQSRIIKLDGLFRSEEEREPVIPTNPVGSQLSMLEAAMRRGLS